MNLSLYFVTPDGAEGLEQLVAAAVRGGATLVQLRDKHRSDAELIPLARRLVAALDAQGVPLIVNDRIEVVLASGAAGLHVGQGDLGVAEARRRIGPDRLLGLSVEAPEHLEALPLGIVDYVGAGPVRATASKPDHAPPIGFEGLARLVAAAPVPAVAIGGLGAGDAHAVKAAGAAGMAIVSAIGAAADPEAAARALALEWERA
ncbi:thiamine phosphate synthase [Rhodobacter sphaeroides]|jgi:thiamine-phosphate diphosphorylase|uniref:Thiamine-phosphate synthase n=1 Tax=Cereibacter sphaeroides (strain ATCC 17023 / DSM 158 / JCM 6121 / CCUG 31486 / LMG 2827 / NBRC 12203 / NCIMB 8253 / ATH 2.4.1.) TaxID=272943 RepID=Q3J062_CERS4|nr:thiamine phosphate synthase [Cereibacter sphaeroides]ABA79822.1 thiamine-phosphate diphosphorylase [Cereibacter sphaeroides 2.4.1]AMJ48095.1 thiamine-phosphate synthase [Cereibacter sphaeroides]ANS34805.1 thiamine phosphate synthase [Cereibacter sphaeroides]ATN63854.1 thiamine phosphate synthase [Cereibacter sphaeroides]AXC62027.1 thiamine phosphate synthase [Cereibacter sphaeroides 2.4.1]